MPDTDATAGPVLDHQSTESARDEPVGDGREVQAGREQAVTDAVLASFAGTSDPRLRELFGTLVTHLHAFAREVRLTQPEWAAAVDFLTRCGHITDERRQEFILLSDVLGLSMLTVGINAPARAGATESTVLGPFFVDDSPHVPTGGDAAGGADGQPCYFAGSVRDTQGRPVPGARVEVWESDEHGLYDVQYGGERTAARGHLFTDDEGAFAFWAVRPAPYPIPNDGPVGELLTASGRSPMRPAHIHFMISAPGLATLTTHLFVEGSPHLDDDAVFGVKQSLVVPFEECPAGVGPGGRRLEGPWARADFHFVLVEQEAH